MREHCCWSTRWNSSQFVGSRKYAEEEEEKGSIAWLLNTSFLLSTSRLMQENREAKNRSVLLVDSWSFNIHSNTDKFLLFYLITLWHQSCLLPPWTNTKSASRLKEVKSSKLRSKHHPRVHNQLVALHRLKTKQHLPRVRLLPAWQTDLKTKRSTFHRPQKLLSRLLPN